MTGGAHHADTPWVFRWCDRTPCCDTVPRRFDHNRCVCKVCGTIYRNVTVDVCDAFPGAVDVTTMTPRRFREMMRCA